MRVGGRQTLPAPSHPYAERRTQYLAVRDIVRCKVALSDLLRVLGLEKEQERNRKRKGKGKGKEKERKKKERRGKGWTTALPFVSISVSASNAAQ